MNIEKLKRIAAKLPFTMFPTLQQMEWAMAMAREEEKEARKKLFESLGANPDGSPKRDIPTDLSDPTRTISGERLESFFRALSKESAKYRAKAGRTKRNSRSTKS